MERLSNLRDPKSGTVLDAEIAHKKADQLLCEAIIEMGFEELVFAFDRVPKWYI